MLDKTTIYIHFFILLSIEYRVENTDVRASETEERAKR